MPDGDTGTNLALTMRGIVEALEQSTASTEAQLASEIQREATMAAKGNSGVILSTIVRGMCRVLGERQQVDGDVLALALRSGATSAYQAVKIPVEGTMLTVIREMAEEAERPGRPEPAGRRGTRAARSSAATTPCAGRPRCSTSSASRVSSTRAAPGSSSSCAVSSTA